MFERTSVNADTYCGHFLLFAPSNSLAIVVVTVNTKSVQPACFLNDISVMSNDMVSQTAGSSATSVNFFIYFLATRCSAPFSPVNGIPF